MINKVEICGVNTSKLPILSKKEKDGNCVTVSYELPGSFVVCTDKDNNETVYISQLSAKALLKRAEDIFW